MKVFLLPNDKNAYKANLHCHSVLSDGRMTPEELKAAYMAEGYSVIAYTDHGVLLPHNDLADKDFLPLNGYEFDVNEPKIGTKSPKVCHICFIALDKDKTVQNIYYDSKHFEKNRHKLENADSITLTPREYSPKFVSEIMRSGREQGFFVTYNHPVWSMETDEQYCNYHGMNAMEIVNYGCVVEGYDDRNGVIYDRMLEAGERIYCIATDDNHNKYPKAHPGCDSFGGFTVILADRLEYSAITQALVDGSFYASEGPEIKELYIEDGEIRIKTSEAASIVMNTGIRRARVACADAVGETITEGVFSGIDPTWQYVRFTVYDKFGKCAYTNAFFLDELPRGALGEAAR